MKDSYELTDDSGAAILCNHVAEGRLPILLATKDEPIEPTDSGWQFLCGSDEHDDKSNFRVWSVREVTELDPSLTQWVDLPPPTSLFRSNVGESWKIEETS